jgi:cation transport ATPase
VERRQSAIEDHPEDAGEDQDVRNAAHDNGDDHEQGGHDGHGDHAAQFRDRFWLTLVLAIPVVIWAPMIQDWFGYTAPSVPGDQLIAPVLGSIIFFYGGWPFLAGAKVRDPPLAARDDAADRHGDHRGLRRVAGDLARAVRHTRSGGSSRC